MELTNKEMSEMISMSDMYLIHNRKIKHHLVFDDHQKVILYLVIYPDFHGKLPSLYDSNSTQNSTLRVKSGSNKQQKGKHTLYHKVIQII